MNKMGCVLELMVGKILLGEQVGGKIVQKEQLQELIQLGFLHYGNGQNNEAIKYFKQALKVCERADIHNNLGLVYLNEGDYGKAVNAFKKALQIDASFLPSFYNLGITLYYGKSYDVAAEIFEDITKAQGVEKDILANVHNDRGCALNRKNDLEKAEKAYKAALAIDETFVRPYVNLGNLYCNKGEFDKAKVEYEKAVKIDDTCAAAHNGLGVVAVEEGKLDQAETHFNKALEVDQHCNAAKYNKIILKERAKAAATAAQDAAQEAEKKLQNLRK